MRRLVPLGGMAMAILFSLGGRGSTTGSPEALFPVPFPKSIPVDLKGANVQDHKTFYTFETLQDFSQRQLKVSVRLPKGFAQRPFSAIQLFAKDQEGHWQNTVWSLGLITAENTHYDPGTGILTLTYRPTEPRIDPQGYSARGFNPKHIRLVGIKMATPGDGHKLHLQGEVEVVEALVQKATAPLPPPAVMAPLLKKDAGLPAGPARPVAAGRVKTGISRFMEYGDFHRYSETRFQKVFKELHAQKLTGFRLMPAWDTRHGFAILNFENQEKAFQSYLKLSRKYRIKHNIITLFDGALDNPPLRRAMTDPARRAELFRRLEPFLKEFGKAEIHGEPLVFDPVNEIMSLGDVAPSQKQEFVDQLIPLFPPGAVITIGVNRLDELEYWLYLPEKFKSHRFLYSFHLYDRDMASLPAAWELNLPDGTEVGVTETLQGDSPEQIRRAGEKGYQWLLFWTDESGNAPYSARSHGEAVKKISR